MQPPKVGAVLKPTLDTKFHIDYSWWERSDENLRTYLLTHLPPERREHFQTSKSEDLFDYINPETGAVLQLDELGLAIQETAQSADFINPQTSLIDSVFRVFLMNGNRPRTPRELEIDTGKPADTILKTLGGIKIYKGIRPHTLNS
jgi:hypothetical protein